MRNCAYCCWTFLNAAFMIAAIIVWRILTCFLKKTDCSDSDVILKKELSYSFLCQADLFCVEVEVKECCVYNDLSLSRLEVNKSFVFKISDTAETDESFIDSCVLNIEVDEDWKNCKIFTNWRMFSWEIICLCSAENC